MPDIRIERLAKLLVNYSLEIKPGDRVLLQGAITSEPLIEAAYLEVLKAGGIPRTNIYLTNAGYHFFTIGNEQQLQYVWKTDKELIEEVDASLYLYGGSNTRAYSNVDQSKLMKSQKANGVLFNRRMERSARGEMRWCIGLFPTPSDAQEANMSTRAFEDFAYAACHCDKEDPVAEWRKMNEELSRIGAWLKEHKEFRVVAEGTDLTYNSGGRAWEVDAGKHNMPDGELCTAPLEDSVNGHIRFTFPAIYNGQIVEDIFLRFENGVVVEGKAKTGQAVLDSVLATDEGARRLGEAAIGYNYAIDRHIKAILFDEKIGGTVHFAIGSAIQEVGGKNISAIHWDMLCDLRNGGEYYADGELFYKDGKFLELK